jgi:hypothetical protein
MKTMYYVLDILDILDTLDIHDTFDSLDTLDKHDTLHTPLDTPDGCPFPPRTHVHCTQEILRIPGNLNLCFKNHWN